MSPPDFELDERLRSLFGGLDTRPDFDARLMARLRAESRTEATERAMRARQQERARYRRAVSELQSWRRSMLRLLTLDTLGIALVLAVGVVAARPYFSRNIMDVWRQYAPYIATLLSILIATVPLLGMWAEQTRRRIQLL
jgi:hypothetical protein